MFQGVARHWEHIFFLLTSPKCDLGKVEKALFQGLAYHFELIFGLLTIPKCDLGEVRKTMIQIVEWYFEVTFKGSQGTYNSFSASWPGENATFVKMIKRRFMCSNGN